MWLQFHLNLNAYFAQDGGHAISDDGLVGSVYGREFDSVQRAKVP